MSLNSEFPGKSSRNTDPGLIAQLKDYKVLFPEESEQGRSRIDSSLLSVLRTHLAKENSDHANKLNFDRWLASGPGPRWKRSIEASQQLDIAGVDVCLRILNDLWNIPGDDAGRIRVAVIEVLSSLREAAPIEPLIFALADPYWDVRAAAAQALGNMGESTPVDLLTFMLSKEEDESVQETLIRALGRQGKRMPVSKLVEILRYDKSWMSRQAAAWALGELGSDAPLKGLIYALKQDEDESVRAAAARSLGQTGKQQAKKALYEALLDLEEEVREEAKRAIQRLEGVDLGKVDVVMGRLDVVDSALERVSDAEREPLDDMDFYADSEPDTGPELTSIPTDEIENALPSDNEERRTSIAASPIWGESWNEQIIRLLTNFLKGKKGKVSQPKMLQTAEGPVLLLVCFYEYSSVLGENILQSFQQATSVQSIEKALYDQDEVVGQVVKQTFDVWGEREWIDWLIVSLVLSHQPKKGKQESTELRVMISGMSGRTVRTDDPLVIDQIVSAWIATLGEPTVCQRPQDLTHVKMWYQRALEPANNSRSRKWQDKG